MKRMFIGVAIASLLLVAASFGENAPTTLSELEKQVASDAAKVGQPGPASQETIADYSRYRLEEEAKHSDIYIAASLGYTDDWSTMRRCGHEKIGHC